MTIQNTKMQRQTTRNNDVQQQLLRQFNVPGHVPHVQIYYDVQIQAKIKQNIKPILYRQKGLIPAESFTAILGPSGSGKTTLLNFLSSRLSSDNLKITGQIKINSKQVQNLQLYSNQIGYVMQQDALLGTLTPRQSFLFAARLTLNLTEDKLIQKVQQLILDLGLKSCADTKIGNTFIKGISGGQRKRTSIGVQLITNPGIIFLDEPTTGLDSTTALQVIYLLKKLAQQGRTVISTIHQPSSQLFCQFDRLMLLCEGHCIYHGASEKAKSHFKNLGYQCPPLMNASQFYLDMMSLQNDHQNLDQTQYQKAKQAHGQKILQFQNKFIESQYFIIQPNNNLLPLQIRKKQEVSIFYEIYLIMARSLICLIRNPMDFGFKLIQTLFTAIIVVIVFGKIDQNSLQNLRGVIFFLVSSNAFAGVQGTLSTLSSQRPVFLRQRYSKIYSTSSYFFARTTTNFPFELVYPTVGLTIVYFATGFGNETAQQFLKLVVMVNALYFCSASYGLFYSAIIPKLQTAMALVPVLIIPFMLLSGFFINLNDYVDVRVIFYPIMYLSPFKYGYQGGMIAINQVFQVYTPDGFWYNILVLMGIGFVFRFIALISMYKVSNPKRPTIHKFKQIKSLTTIKV